MDGRISCCGSWLCRDIACSRQTVTRCASRRVAAVPTPSRSRSSGDQQAAEKIRNRGFCDEAVCSRESRRSQKKSPELVPAIYQPKMETLGADERGDANVPAKEDDQWIIRNSSVKAETAIEVEYGY